MDKRTNEQLTMKVYKFVVDYKSNHDGNSPTFREIQEGCGMSSHNHARYHLEKLESQGLIRFADGSRKRGIEIIGAQWVPPVRVEIPALGRDARG